MKTTGNISLSSWLEEARLALAGLTDRPMQEAHLLLAHVLQKPNSWLLTHADQSLSPGEAETAQHLLQGRLRGEPLPYLLGEWPFFGRDFYVSADVLIPRPETELLVENALAWLKSHPKRRLALDVGAGSGCIAVSLAAEVDDLMAAAVDISAAALETAGRNIRRYSLEERVKLVRSDLLTEVEGAFDLVCANLPYIPNVALDELEVAKHEPRLALDGGPDGLRLIERLLRQLPAHINPGGLAVLEIEAGQEGGALQLAAGILPACRAAVLKDLADQPRLLRIETSGN